MVTATNINVKQKLSSFSNTKSLNATSNHPNFSEKIHIGTNGNPIKTFANCLFSFVNPTIFPKAKL
jgi:hypothetical protein